MATRASTRNKAATSTSSVPVPTKTRATRTVVATKAAAATTAKPTAPKRTTTRKPASSRQTTAEPHETISSNSKSSTAKTTRKPMKPVPSQPSDLEPIMAYLRIRPRLGEEELASAPYLVPINDTTVRMTEPQENQANRNRFRSSAVPPSSLYIFSHIFPPETTQSDFFNHTTLSLVRDVLQGQNGLLFTYGVTNSGKTYTVQGGQTQGSAGILPRTLDVIFNSIEGLQGDGRYRPVRLYGIEPADDTDTDLPLPPTEPALAEVLGQLDTNSIVDLDVDPTVITVDRNYEHTVWISYVEVYNEKVYDLLESVKEESDQKQAQKNANRALLLTRKALPLRSSPASDNGDTEINGKYISGLRQFRVTSAAQAKSLVKLGQLHRRVFGTLANRESSRSHGMVIIKIVRGHRGEKNDPTSLQVSRLTLVDLAGSERTKHTHTTGDRLKEAGNINKSLMVLGQCMEVLRSNQRKLASSLAQDSSEKDGRMDTRDVRKTLAVVPFRHSKLTEVLMDYFTGEGRAVMIVNVNPCDTGYDENSHVMKFSSLAREVYFSNAPVPVQKAPPIGPGKLQGQKFKDLSPLTINDPDVNPNPFRRKVTITMGKKKEAVLEVMEEEEAIDETDVDDEPLNPLIDALFDEVENLRMQLFEAEMRCALIEADTREEVMREMEDRMRLMEEKYSRRLMTELEQNELKTDAKIDMLHKAGLFGSPIKKVQRVLEMSESEDEEEIADVEMSLMPRDDDETEEEGSQFLEDDEMDGSSPLAGKGKQNQTSTSTTSANGNMSDVREESMLDDITESDEEEETGNNLLDFEAEESGGEGEEEYTEEDEEDELFEAEEESEEEWVPPKNSSKMKPALRKKSEESTGNKKKPVSKIARDMKALTIDDEEQDPDDSVVILPKRSRYTKKVILDSDSEEANESDDDEIVSIPVVKKKKRQLGKKPVITVDNAERVAWEVENKVARTQGNRTIRRLTGDR